MNRARAEHEARLTASQILAGTWSPPLKADYIESEVPTIAQLADEHYQRKVRKGLRPNSLADMRRKLRHTIGESDLVVVARAQNQAEGELLQNLLRAEGVPSLLRRAPGFDVPDSLAAGPREVLVPASAEQAARDVLLPSQRRGFDQ